MVLSSVMWAVFSVLNFGVSSSAHQPILLVLLRDYLRLLMTVNASTFVLVWQFVMRCFSRVEMKEVIRFFLFVVRRGIYISWWFCRFEFTRASLVVAAGSGILPRYLRLRSNWLQFELALILLAHAPRFDIFSTFLLLFALHPVILA